MTTAIHRQHKNVGAEQAGRRWCVLRSPSRALVEDHDRSSSKGVSKGRSPSHGENRGSSPLGSARYFNPLANKATTTVQLLSSFKHQERARLGGYGGCRMAFHAGP